VLEDDLKVLVSVGDPDPDVFGSPGSGSFPFLIKVLRRTEIMLAK
jgi:hypothetical protein